VQLTRLAGIVARRRTLAERYLWALRESGFGLPLEPEWARSNWQSFCVRLPDELDQAAAMQSLLDADIATRRGIMCAHLEPAYAGQAASRAALPESERAQRRTIILPLFHSMTDPQQDRVVQALLGLRSTGAER
jgi:perosamine synthetase